MKKATSYIKGILFDFGGTLDTHGVHWSEQYWDAYVNACVPVSKPQYEKAYVSAGDGMLEGKIKPTDSLKTTLGIQIRLQLEHLAAAGYIDKDSITYWAPKILEACYKDVKVKMSYTTQILQYLVNKYSLVLVSNFYGNMETVLQEFGIRPFFKDVIDSAVVGIRKPDPSIFSIGVNRLGEDVSQVAVVGDSFERDIVPAKKIGCTTIWVKGRSWRNEPGGPEADIVISDLYSLKEIF